MDRDKFLAAIIVPAIVFAFVVGVMGRHGAYGLARAVITVGLTLWILYATLGSTPFLNRLSERARGAIGLGVSALVALEVARVIHIMATDGVAVGDVLILILDLITFGVVFAWGLGMLGATPGRAMYLAAIRANKVDPKRAMKIATRTTRLYRKWDQAWLLRASLTPVDSGVAAAIPVLRDAIRYCPRSEEIRERLISALYLNGDGDEATAMLRQFKVDFPHSGRGDLMDALNSIGDKDWGAAQLNIAKSLKKAEKDRDHGALIHIAAVVGRHPDHFDTGIALEALESAIGLDSGEPSALALLAIMLERDQPARSAALFDQARQAHNNRQRVDSFDDFLAMERKHIEPKMG